MLETLIEWDKWLFLLINGEAHHFVLDAIIPFWRNKYIWFPLYLFLTTAITINFRKQSRIILIFAALTIVLSDQMSSQVIKPTFERLRPCKHPDFSDQVRLLVPCGSGKSFVSAHATNHFAIAVYAGLLFRFLSPYLLPLALFWAGSIAYGQVYVGVHYPSDVFFGALLGVIIGLLTYYGAWWCITMNQKNKE